MIPGVGHRRLDLAMVDSAMAFTRSHAARLIADGLVTIDGRVADKAARKVPPDAQIAVRDGNRVGRGGLKLRGALDTFGFSVEGQRCVDVGASTGGFTQVLLERGATQVVAVDVGHDQLDARLRADPRVINHEGVNARHVAVGEFGEPFPVVVADLSFISLTLVAEGISNMASGDADVVLLVKPQFEVGREHIGRTGLVTDGELHRQAIARVLAEFATFNWQLRMTVESPVVGNDGNQEFFVWLRKKS